MVEKRWKIELAIRQGQGGGIESGKRRMWERLGLLMFVVRGRGSLLDEVGRGRGRPETAVEAAVVLVAAHFWWLLEGGGDRWCKILRIIIIKNMIKLKKTKKFKKKQ